MSEHPAPVIDDAQPHYQDINTPVVILMTVIAAIVTYAAIAAVQGFYFQWKNAQLERVNAATVTTASAYMAAEKEMMAAGSEERKIQPIAEAMAETVKAWSSPEAATESPAH
jgi:sensor histidine kinase regulating citrate/malate metabolism